MKNEKIEVTHQPDLTASIRDLIIQIHRGNKKPAETIVDQVTSHLRTIMRSGMEPAEFPMQRAQQTLFAIDEVRTLLSQQDLSGALDAARDAGKEWGRKPAS